MDFTKLSMIYLAYAICILCITFASWIIAVYYIFKLKRAFKTAYPEEAQKLLGPPVIGIGSDSYGAFFIFERGCISLIEKDERLRTMRRKAIIAGIMFIVPIPATIVIFLCVMLVITLIMKP